MEIGCKGIGPSELHLGQKQLMDCHMQLPTLAVAVALLTDMKAIAPMEDA